MALIGGPTILIAGVITTVVSSLIVAEIKSWSPWILRTLFTFAIERLPENRRERLREEWQSHLNDVPGQFGKLLVAIGFVIAGYSVSWNDRLKHKAEAAWLPILLKRDEIESTIVRTLNLVESDQAIARQVDTGLLRSQLSDLQKTRNQLVRQITIFYAAPRGLISKLTDSFAASRLRRTYQRFISQKAREARESGARIETMVEKMRTNQRDK